MAGHPEAGGRVSEGDQRQVGVSRRHGKHLVGCLMVRLDESPFGSTTANAQTHLRDVAPCREFDGCPYCAPQVDTVASQVIEGPQFVTLRDPEAEGHVGLSLFVGGHVTEGIDRQGGLRASP